MRRVRLALLAGLLLAPAVLAGCAFTPPPESPDFPDFPKQKAGLGRVAVLADVTSLHYVEGNVQRLDLPESEQHGTTFLDAVTRGLQAKSYAVTSGAHLTSGWTMRPGTRVFLVRTPGDRGRSPLPEEETPIFVSPRLGTDPALRQAWLDLRGSVASRQDPGPVATRLAQAFDADTLVVVVMTGHLVPADVEAGRARTSAMTLGHVNPPAATSGGSMILFADARAGKVLWRAWSDGKRPPLSEQSVRAEAQALLEPLP